MKKISIAAILLAASLLFAPIQAFSAACQGTAKVSIALSARLLELPHMPQFTAKGQGEICYDIDGKTAKIKGESIPKLTYESDKPPAGLSALTVFVDTLPGTTPSIQWTSFPDIVLDHLDVRLRAYEASMSKITKDLNPIVDIAIPDITLSTKPIVVEGKESSGYVDADSLEAKLVGRVVLPDDDFPEYQELLEGQTILAELLIKIQNPFKN